SESTAQTLTATGSMLRRSPSEGILRPQSFPFKDRSREAGKGGPHRDEPARPVAHAAGRFFVMGAATDGGGVRGGPTARLMDEAEIRRALTRVAHELLARNKGARHGHLDGTAAP